MSRLNAWVSLGAAMAMAPSSLSAAQAQTADKPEAIVCQLLGNCSDTADSVAPTGDQNKPRPVRRGDTRGFSLARPKSPAEAVAPMAMPTTTRPAMATNASRNRPKSAPAGQYDLRVLFMTGSAEVNPTSRDQVNAFAAALKDSRLSGRRVRIEGHTDATGIAAKNQDLSQRRAQAIADMLASSGVDSSLLDVRGFGSAQPLPGTKPTSGANRRVVAVLAN